MGLTAYAKDVFRFGKSAKLFHPDDSEYYVCSKSVAAPHEIHSDGMGNVSDQPLIYRRPCFGRPEAFIRTAFDWPGKDYICKIAGIKPALNRCHRCPVRDACTDLCIERIESDATIDRALGAFFSIADGLPDRRKFKDRNAQRAWIGFLHAIREHGGWTNINDLRVVLHERDLHQARASKKRDSARAKRRNMRLARQGRSNPLTPTFVSAVAAERDRRLHVLQQCAVLPGAPRFISKLPPAGMRRTADVWEAQQLFTRQGLRVTGRAVAEWLVHNGKARPASLGSLTTSVLRDLTRIANLEREVTGTAIWTRFKP